MNLVSVACWVYFGGKILQAIGTVGVNFGRDHGWRRTDLRVTVYGWERSPKERAWTEGRGGPGKHSHGKNTEHKELQGGLRRHSIDKGESQRGRNLWKHLGQTGWVVTVWSFLGKRNLWEQPLLGGHVVTSTVVPYLHAFL